MASGSKKVIFAALFGNLLISITKFIAAGMTGSSAILSEGIHSVVDTGNQVLLLYGIKRANRPADACHPFGHSREIYFWSFIVAILIFAVGAGVSMYEGISHILHPSELRDPTVNYVVLGLAMLFEGGAWLFALKEFSRVKGKRNLIQAVHHGKDPSMFVVLFEDTAAMLGLVVAFVGIYVSHATGNPVYDGAASVVIGVILALTAAWLAYETKELLIGESAQQDVVLGIKEMAVLYSEVRAVNEVLTMHMGPADILVNISIDFEDNLTAAHVETAIQRLDHDIKSAYPHVKRVFIEAESRKGTHESMGKVLS